MGKAVYPSSYRGAAVDLREVAPSGPVCTYRLSPEELAQLEARLPRRPEKRPRFTLGQRTSKRERSAARRRDS